MRYRIDPKYCPCLERGQNRRISHTPELVAYAIPTGFVLGKPYKFPVCANHLPNYRLSEAFDIVPIRKRRKP